MASSPEAASVAEKFPGWHVWVTAEGRSMVATRTGSTAGLEPRTLICDDWTALESQLAEQAEADRMALA